MWGPRGRFRQAVARMSSSITDATDTLLGRRNGPVLLFGLFLSLSLALSLSRSLALSRSPPLSLEVESARCLFTAVLLCDSAHFEALCGRAAAWVRARMYEHAVVDAGAAAALRTDDPRVYSLEVLSLLALLVQKYTY